MSFLWTRNAIEKLMVLIQQHPCIYSVRSKDYLNRTKKSEAFNQVCIQMQELKPTITLFDIKKKWGNLRIQYMAEKRRMVQSKKSGVGVSDILRPKLWCFDQLSFLDGHTQVKESKCNIEKTEELSESLSKDCGMLPETTDEDSSCYNVVGPSPCSENNAERPRKKKKKLQQTYAFEKELAVLKSLAERRAKDAKKYAWLGSLVVSQMEDIDVEHQAAACWEVQCVMNKYVQLSRQKKNCPSLNSGSTNGW